jgi:uncharacterized membrane protein
MDAMQPTAINEVNFVDSPIRKYVFVFLTLLPFFYLVTSGLYLHSQWDNIASRIPVHYGLNLKVDGWAGKNFWGVYGFLFVGFGIAVGLAAVSRMLLVLPPKHTEPQERILFERARVKGTLLLLGFMNWCTLHICCISIVRALFSGLPHAVFLALGVPAVLVALIFLPLYFWLVPKQPVSSTHWKWDFFYWNPNDPSLVVERRYGYGFTLNFGRPLAWVYIAFVFFPLLVVIISLIIISLVSRSCPR